MTDFQLSTALCLSLQPVKIEIDCEAKRYCNMSFAPSTSTSTSSSTTTSIPKLKPKLKSKSKSKSCSFSSTISCCLSWTIRILLILTATLTLLFFIFIFAPDLPLLSSYFSSSSPSSPSSFLSSSPPLPFHPFTPFPSSTLHYLTHYHLTTNLSSLPSFLLHLSSSSLLDLDLSPSPLLSQINQQYNLSDHRIADALMEFIAGAMEAVEEEEEQGTNAIEKLLYSLPIQRLSSRHRFWVYESLRLCPSPLCASTRKKLHRFHSLKQLDPSQANEDSEVMRKMYTRENWVKVGLVEEVGNERGEMERIGKLWARAMGSGKRVYVERVIHMGGVEYEEEWNERRHVVSVREKEIAKMARDSVLYWSERDEMKELIEEAMKEHKRLYEDENPVRLEFVREYEKLKERRMEENKKIKDGL